MEKVACSDFYVRASSRNESSRIGSKRFQGSTRMKISIVSNWLGLPYRYGRKRDEIKSYTVIAVFFSGGSRAYTSGVLAPAISRPTPVCFPPPPVFYPNSFRSPLCPKDSGPASGHEPCNTPFRKTYYGLISPFCLSRKKTMPFRNGGVVFVCSFYIYWIVIAFQLTRRFMVSSILMENWRVEVNKQYRC